uniref:Uncharacterized protein n=1 Tax=Cacopsylla melanoneura TaxID=428564 RepID=A0A8D8Y496_9HEMI
MNRTRPRNTRSYLERQKPRKMAAETMRQTPPSQQKKTRLKTRPQFFSARHSLSTTLEDIVRHICHSRGSNSVLWCILRRTMTSVWCSQGCKYKEPGPKLRMSLLPRRKLFNEKQGKEWEVTKRSLVLRPYWILKYIFGVTNIGRGNHATLTEFTRVSNGTNTIKLIMIWTTPLPR